MSANEGTRATRYFIAESDPVLARVKEWIKLYRDARNASISWAAARGVDRWLPSEGGRLIAIADGYKLAGFKRADRKGRCWPMAKHPVAAELKALPEAPRITEFLNEVIKCPTSLSWEARDASGSSGIGGFLSPVGLAFFDADGPYLVWMPDVAKAKAALRDGGTLTKNPKFKPVRKPDLTGLREIMREEWDLMEAQHNAKVARKPKRAVRAAA